VMEGVCDIGLCRWARSEERGDAMRIVSDERRRPATKADVPEGCTRIGRGRVAPSPPMRKASPAPTLLTAPYLRATQTPSITQRGS
jgi:hypothetical protein